jgi:hypothetical protein
MGSIRKSTLGFLRGRWKTWKWSTKLQRQPRVDVVYRRQPRAQVWAEESHEWSAMQHFQAMIKPWDIRREDGQPRAFCSAEVYTTCFLTFVLGRFPIGPSGTHRLERLPVDGLGDCWAFAVPVTRLLGPCRDTSWWFIHHSRDEMRGHPTCLARFKRSEDCGLQATGSSESFELA